MPRHLVLILCLLTSPVLAQVTPSWIWSAKDPRPGELVRFRRAYDVPFGPRQATLTFTCDDAVKVWIGGREVGRSSRWQKPVTMDVTRFIRRGRGVITMEARNTGGHAGLLLHLDVAGSGTERFEVASGTTFRWGTPKDDSWHRPDFDERGWSAAVALQPYGSGPWGFVLNNAQREGGGATPADQLKLPPGFKAELVHTVDRKKHGSWVSLAVDPKGRLYTSAQHHVGILRITPPAIAAEGKMTIEKMDVPLGKAHGLLWAFDSLYVVVNDKKVAQGSGLYRCRDTDGDDVLDEAKLLRNFEGGTGSEHGPHAIVPAPDGRSIYVIAGNYTRIPKPETAAAARVWAEDGLLPRIWDPRGHAVGLKAPGGWICRTDPDGKAWHLVANGFRNPYDMAFNEDGALFTFDADMEWDMGTPWYRPTRINHVIEGAEYGWRAGTGKWPEYYPDSLGSVVDVGASSPTGVLFGTGARFPLAYEKALFALDWTYGTIYAVHLTPKDGTYTGKLEKFVVGKPLPVTDAVINPKDGAMYFTIGGRGVQSALYRVFWTGDIDEAEASESYIADPHAPKPTAEQKLESCWPMLGHAHRIDRFRARVTLESLPVSMWAERAFAEKNGAVQRTALLALTRLGGKELQPRILAALDAMPWEGLSDGDRLDVLRIYGLAMIRMGRPGDDRCRELADRLDGVFPWGEWRVDHELARLLAYLGHPRFPQKALALLEAAPRQEDAIHYALCLRIVREGWSSKDRARYFHWLHRARDLPGGASLQGFIKKFAEDALAAAPEKERAAMQDILGQKRPPRELPKPKGPGRAWKIGDLLPAVQAGLDGRDLENGRTMFAAARCISCHRFDGQGEAIGPDLTGVASRFNTKDLLTTIFEPSRVISDQYRAEVIRTKKQRLVTGRIVRQSGTALYVMEDPYDPDALTEVKLASIATRKPSTTSTMPEGLLDPLNRDEVLDLIAYLLSGGK